METIESIHKNVQQRQRGMRWGLRLALFGGVVCVFGWVLSQADFSGLPAGKPDWPVVRDALMKLAEAPLMMLAGAGVAGLAGFAAAALVALAWGMMSESQTEEGFGRFIVVSGIVGGVVFLGTLWWWFLRIL